MAKKPHPPGRVIVGSFAYDFKPWPAKDASGSGEQGKWGECDHTAGVIRVSDGLTCTQTANTFLHEVLHAIWLERSLADGADQETYVDNFANGLLALMWSNPDLVAYLMACKPR